jgi:hypothetical protein
MSQLDLASRAGFSRRHTSFIETGQTRPSRQALRCSFSPRPWMWHCASAITYSRPAALAHMSIGKHPSLQKRCRTSVASCSLFSTGMSRPIHIKRDDLEFRLFSTIMTLGMPQDVTLQELRIEAFFPADDESEAFGCESPPAVAPVPSNVPGAACTPAARRHRSSNTPGPDNEEDLHRHSKQQWRRASAPQQQSLAPR